MYIVIAISVNIITISMIDFEGILSRSPHKDHHFVLNLLLDLEYNVNCESVR